ncbi:hypothetical protein [Desulfobacula sp.]|uniref:AMP-binding enzyme n=1 Tax=Desulfobacula sp. TaxID=2593537 RepID=UPI00261E9D3B|nr:hypothetical protein [Desulfobacula sp.]
MAIESINTWFEDSFETYGREKAITFFRGEKVVALVQKTEGVELTEAKIKSVCKEKLHDWKCPKKILFTDNIPKNTMGKVLKKKVKSFFIKGK